jgi:nucleoside-diphosphate-sugar epimerase
LGDVIPHNIDAVLSLFEAARSAGVPRVFASSNWVLGGHRFGRGPLGAATEPAPLNPYGMSKLMGERIGAHFAAVHGMTVVCIRIGWRNGLMTIAQALAWRWEPGGNRCGSATAIISTV